MNIRVYTSEGVGFGAIELGRESDVSHQAVLVYEDDNGSRILARFVDDEAAETLEDFLVRLLKYAARRHVVDDRLEE